MVVLANPAFSEGKVNAFQCGLMVDTLESHILQNAGCSSKYYSGAKTVEL